MRQSLTWVSLVGTQQALGQAVSKRRAKISISLVKQRNDLQGKARSVSVCKRHANLKSILYGITYGREGSAPGF